MDQMDQSEKKSEEVKVVQVRQRSLKEIDHPSWDLQPHLVRLFLDEPFYGALSRQSRKIATDDIPTMGVAFDDRRDDLVLYYNPEWCAKLAAEEHGDGKIRFVLLHEWSHVLFGHVSSRKHTPHNVWNIATDLAINSSLSSLQHHGNNTIKPAVPEQVLMPGKRPKLGSDSHLGERERAALNKLSDLIERMEGGYTSEQYYYALMQTIKEDPDLAAMMLDQDQVVFVPLDDHDMWDPRESPGKSSREGTCEGEGNGSDQDQGDGPGSPEYRENRIKDIVDKAMKNVKMNGNSWGSVPAELQRALEQWVSGVIDWKSILRSWIGTIVRGHRTSSIKRVNRKYPYVHPGTKRNYVPKFLLAMDQSGSVSDEMLCAFFAEIWSLGKQVELDYIPFDCAVDIKDLKVLKKGARPPPIRERSGGTNFSVIAELVNDPKNRGRWDGVIMLTDGCAPKPLPSVKRRAWVLGEGCKLEFDTDEQVIVVSKDQAKKGAWR